MLVETTFSDVRVEKPFFDRDGREFMKASFKQAILWPTEEVYVFGRDDPVTTEEANSKMAFYGEPARRNPGRKRFRPAEPQTGWWEISYTVDPDEGSLDHIAQMIVEGYIEGQIINGDGKTGWWDVTFTDIEPDEVSLEHVGDSIREGYTEGEVINRDILEPGQRP